MLAKKTVCRNFVKMSRMAFMLLGLAVAMPNWATALAGTIKVTGLGWDATKQTLSVSIAAEASTKDRTVYLVWDDADKGENWLDWERGEIIGTLAAGETSATFAGDKAYLYAKAYRVFTFDANGTGDGYLAYVTTTGAQYIDTGLKASYQSKVWADYNWTDTTGQRRVFGTKSTFIMTHYISGSSATGGFLAYGCKDGGGNWKNYSNVVDKNRVALTLDSYCDNYAGRYRIERDGAFICDKTVSDDVAVTNRTKTSSDNMRVCHGTGDEAKYWSKLNLYRFRMWSAGDEQIDLRPYVKGGVVGCKDAINGEFFASATKTAFVAGPRLGTTALDVSAVLPNSDLTPDRVANGIIDGGKYETANLPGGALSDLSNSTSIVIRDGTFKFAGRDGEKGYYDGDIVFAAPDTKASTFDITGDLTLGGSVINQAACGAFVKSGPGTLRIPGTDGNTYTWKMRGPADNKALLAYAPKADGTTPDQGYTYFSLIDGRLVLGENGGNFNISVTSGSDLQIGTMTVDPLTQAGEQEKEAVLEVAGGTTTLNNWVAVGAKNGFVTTCPEKMPESGIRVTGGKLYCKASLSMGRNKSSVPQKDASGNWIAPRCCPFIEVLGGELRLWNTSRIGFCDNAGADTRILVDKGLLYVCNKDNTTGSEIILGSSTDSENTAPRTCETTIRNGGRLDCTGFRIPDSTSRINITNRISVVDGGIWRINTFAKSSKQASCWSSILFDGGIGEIRYNGYTGWISADISRASIGTRGATFRAGSGCAKSVLDYVRVPLEADDTHPDEEPQGLTITYNTTDKNSGFVLTKKNTYKGSTTIKKFGRLEFAEEGEFPATSDVIFGQGGRLMVTNIAHTVKSLTFGNSYPGTATTTWFALEVGKPITAGHCAVVGKQNISVALYEKPCVQVTTADTYELVKAPASDIGVLKTLAAQMKWAHSTETLDATFSAEVEGEQAVIKMTVGEVVTPTVHPAAGGTEEVSSFAEIREEGTGIVRLGKGTIVYSGTGETITNMVGAPVSGFASVLQVANDLTLYGFTSLSGMLWKTGPGDLYLKGNGEFIIGNESTDFDASKPQGIDAEGNPPNNCSKGFSIADGRVIIGVKDNPENAPHVLATAQLGIGIRTAARDSGKMETAGELILNNGLLDVNYVGLDYYNGYPETTPPEGLHPKLTINGGKMVIHNSNYFVMGCDWQGLHTSSPSFEINGGSLETEGEFYIGQQVSTGIVGNVTTFTMNGGAVKLWNKLCKIGNVATASKVVANFNGGDMYCLNFGHSGNAASDDKGCAEVLFNGTTFHFGYGRSQGGGYTIMNTKEQYRFNKAYIGKGGFIIDFDEWTSIGTDWGVIDLRQAFLHDPNCEGLDGGITIRNGSTVIFRTEMNGSTFNGPITIENGSVLGMDMNWRGFTNTAHQVTIGPKSGIRFSGQIGVLRTVTFGETGAIEPVTLDLCQPSSSAKGLVVLDSVRVLSPITVSFHRNGGICNDIGVWLAGGKIDLLTYPASCDADVPLEKFVANEKLPTMKVTYAKEDVTDGEYTGYKKITLTVEPSTAADEVTAGTAWNSTSAGGAWSDGSNWEGGASVNAANALAQFKAAQVAGVPVNVDTPTTAGRIVLRGDDVAKGYALSGQRLNLQNDGWNVLPEICALTGSHTVANDIGTDFVNIENVEAAANGGTLGAVGISSYSNATLTVTGAIASNDSYPIYVNPSTRGGGRTVFDATVTGGEGVQVRSGTMEIDDLNKLNGRKLTVGPGTLHYTGPDASTETPIWFDTGANNLTSILRIDNRLTLNGVVTNGSMKTPVMKTGPGELVVNGIGYYRIGGESNSTDWNNSTVWPDNGDSAVMTSAAFCLDEGTVSVGREGQTCQFGTGTSDIFIGSQPRGWAYSSDTIKLNMYGGYMTIGFFGLGHGMHRGTDKAMSDTCYVEYNQYAGVVTNQSVYMGYDLTAYDSHIRASMNLYGGTFLMRGYIRLGQTYNKTGNNEPYSKLFVDGGSLVCTRENHFKGNIYIPYSENLSQLKNTQNRASDAELTIRSGMITNAYLLLVGQNGGRGEVHLDGGLLNCENIVHRTYAEVGKDTNYRAYDVTDGTSYIYFNGGVFQPMSAMESSVDKLACLKWNATLSNFTELLVQEGGAKFDLTALKADAYTIGQTITGAAGDGGLVKTGEKPLILAAQCTYHGETTIAEGVLRVGAAAPAGEILPNSTVRICAGATLEYEAGAQATITKLVVDCAAGEASLVNAKATREGALYLENVTGNLEPGLVLPLNVTGKFKTSQWDVYVNGVKQSRSLVPVVRNGKLMLDRPSGLTMFIQ